MESNSSLIRKPGALIPLGMALVALALPFLYVAFNGLARQEDEGLAAHLWQFLIVAQAPFVAFFAIKWLPRAPKQALIVLALQAVIVFAAFAAVFIMESMAR